MAGKKDELVLSSKIPFVNQNQGKMDFLALAHAEFVKASNFYVDTYWDYYNMDDKKWHRDAYSQKKFYPKICGKPPGSLLSGRMLKCCMTQAKGIIKSATARISRLHWMLSDINPDKKTFSEGKILRLEKELKHRLLTLKKPRVSPDMGMELNSVCCKFVKNNTKTGNFVLMLHAVFSREYKKEHKIENAVRFVCRSHKHNNRLCREGQELPSFLVFKDGFNVRYNMDLAPERKSGRIAAIDTGMRYVITLIDSKGNVQQSKPCIHGHTLLTICKDMIGKKKGSLNYRKAQDHRTNYVNWAINQIDFTDIVEVRVERLFDMNRGRRVSELLKKFPFRGIEQKLQKECMRNGVRFVLQSNMYRSQRCSSCGFVHSDNRNGEKFHCLNCGYENHADVNACENHIANLKAITWKIPSSKTTGFFWIEEDQEVVLADSLQSSVPNTSLVIIR